MAYFHDLYAPDNGKKETKVQSMNYFYQATFLRTKLHQI